MVGSLAARSLIAVDEGLLQLGTHLTEVLVSAAWITASVREQVTGSLPLR